MTQPLPPRRRRPLENPQTTMSPSEFGETFPDVSTPPAPEPPAMRKRGRKPAEPEGEVATPVPPVDVAPLFGTVPNQRMRIEDMPVPSMQHGFERIVHNLFETGYDVFAEYEKVRDSLVIRDSLTPERLRVAANEQEDIARRAHQLYIIARVEVFAYQRETETLYGAIRAEANEKLQREKETGGRSKQITEADILSTCAQLYPDQWDEVCGSRERADAMLKQLENLAQLARSRCYTVSAMANPGFRSV